MKRTTLTCLLFLTLTMSTVPAGAHEFLASTTGKTTIKILATSIFTTAAGKAECTGATLLEGEVKSLKATTLTSTVQFTGCKAFGLAATVSPAKFKTTAEGNVSLLKTATVKAPACLVTIPSVKNQNLGTIKYKNTNKGIEKVASGTAITSEGTGTACSYAQESKGTFQGDALVNLIGGTLDWK